MQKLLGILRDYHSTPEEKQCVLDEQLRLECGTLSDCSLEGVDISSVNFLNWTMRNVSLRGAICRGTLFPLMRGCCLDNADASAAYFTGLTDCTLRDALLGSVHIGADCRRCVFDGACLQFAKIESRHSGSSRHPCDSSFRRSNLSGFDACGAWLRGAVFSDAYIEHARFSRADCRDCNFDGARLSRCNFVVCRLQNASFRHMSSLGLRQRSCIDSHNYCELRGSMRGAFRVRDKSQGAACKRLNVLFDGTAHDINITWCAIESRTKRVQRGLIWKDAVVAKAAGAGLFSASRRSLVTYPASSKKPLSGWLHALSADLTGWQVAEDTIEVRINKRSATRSDREIVVSAIEEVFDLGCSLVSR